jgi:DNA-binding transcriptional LysR family regulator
MSRLLPPLRLLLAFEGIVRGKSMQRAAEELNVSQPAISQALKQLEDFVGARLIDRRTRPISLTEAGRILAVGTVEGLQRIADAMNEIRALTAKDDESVTVACSVGFGTYWLMPRLAAFYGEYPDIAVNVLTTLQGSPNLAPGVDLAMRYGSGRWTDGQVYKLLDERVVPVCSPALRDNMPERDLETLPLLHVNVDEQSWVTWAQYLSAVDLPPNTAKGRQFNNYVHATQAALDGQGVLLGWDSITTDLLRDGRLVIAGDRIHSPKQAYYMIVGTPARRSAAILRNWLISAAAEDEAARMEAYLAAPRLTEPARAG